MAIIQEPQIHSIFICSNAGSSMVEKQKIKVHIGGIEGDRYSLGLGAFSKSKPSKVRDISLITMMGIDTANHALYTRGLKEFKAGETRRNIVIDNILPEALDELIGKEFTLGGVRLKGIELCTPCERPSKLANKKDFHKAYERFGGIRAQVITGGYLSIGDMLESYNLLSVS